MILTIRQVRDIIVNNGTNDFVFVKRKTGLKIISQFYKDGQLIFESSLYTIFLKQIINIKFQNLPDLVLLERTKGWYYTLNYDDTILSVKAKYFQRPAFRLFKNGSEVGTIGNPKLISIESRFYQMELDTEDEKIALYFLILFLSQLRAF